MRKRTWLWVPYNPIPIEKRKYIRKVVIQDGVVEISDNAFSYCKKIKEVHLPESVTTIGDWAFYACKKLKKINIPQRVKRIGNHAFASCRKLKEISFDNKDNIEFGNRVFEDCDNLEINT